MDGKVSKTMYHCNKKAPKVLYRGTPEVSNHLVRTERRAHIEIVLSTTGENLPQKAGISL